MCGIAGFFCRDPRAAVDVSLVTAMTDRLGHRGPDDGGMAELGPVGLGHRRLSILDLSPLGHQPMATPDGRYWITFNGEIYNFLELRADLEQRGEHFRSRSDTEVLLRLFALEGPDCLVRLNGMFAFAIYDRVEHKLFLARDRLGKKPIYYYEDERSFRFASELKAFFADPTFQPELDPAGIADVLSTLYIPDPRTIYKRVWRLEPATAMWVTRRGNRLWRYWEPPAWEHGGVPFHHQAEDRDGGLKEAVERFETLLTDAVRIRTVSDVPLGAFLSGGVDSSLVVSELARASSHPVRTSTIGFEVAREDESAFAEEAARHLGCDHQTTQVTTGDVGQLLHTLLPHFDEPFADSSALPTWLLCQVTRRRVTVALSGDGGDEAFAGYSKYAADDLERRRRTLLPPRAWNALRALSPCLEPLGARGLRLANGLRTLADDDAARYFRTQSFTSPEWVKRLIEPLEPALGGYDPSWPTRGAWRRAGDLEPLSLCQRVDIETYLPGDILVKVDRMSMAHALEVRCPLLDHRVVEEALRLPPWLRLGHGEGKRVLKAALRPRLPEGFVDRPKHGFSVPVAEWFRGPLQPLFETSVLTGEFADAGLVSLPATRRMWALHQGGMDFGHTLWSLLVTALWFRDIRGRHPASSVAYAPTVVEFVGPWKAHS